MGLHISCKHSDKDISWNYHTLHMIRNLALQTCGVNKELLSIINSCSMGDVDIVRFILSFHPEITIKSEDFYGMQLAGMYYPNLLFHSDCDGDYTAKGKVLSDVHWQHGNLKQLKHELEILLHDAEKIDADFSKEYAKQFLELVTDELQYKCPKIYFG